MVSTSNNSELKFVLIIAIAVIIIMIGALFFTSAMSPSGKLSVGSIQTAATQTFKVGGDSCPDPQTSTTVCVSDPVCVCWLIDSDGNSYPEGPVIVMADGNSCPTTPPPSMLPTFDGYTLSCELQKPTIKQACEAASRSGETPEKCVVDCDDKGNTRDIDKTPQCCTVTVKRVCVEEKR